MDDNFSQFIEWVFYGIIGGAAIHAVSILKEMNESIAKLNISVAKIFEKTTWHEKELERHSDRISSLEKK